MVSNLLEIFDDYIKHYGGADRIYDWWAELESEYLTIEWNIENGEFENL